MIPARPNRGQCSVRSALGRCATGEVNPLAREPRSGSGAAAACSGNGPIGTYARFRLTYPGAFGGPSMPLLRTKLRAGGVQRRRALTVMRR
jgi:hypothetical protein